MNRLRSLWNRVLGRTEEPVVDATARAFAASLRTRGVAARVHEGKLLVDPMSVLAMTTSDLRLIEKADEQELATAVSASRRAAATNADLADQATLMPDEYLKAGFVRLDNGTWCHPEGDDTGNRIVRREITFEDAVARAKERTARSRRLGFLLRATGRKFRG